MKPKKAPKPREERSLLYLAALLFCLVLISTRSVAGLFARYSTGDSAQDSATVAPFVFELKGVENSHYIDLSNIKKPGDFVAVPFEVTNESGGVVSAVAESYSIHLELRGSMPLTASLSSAGGTSPISTYEMNKIEENPIRFTFPAGQNTTHSYTLTLTWPEGEKNPKYASNAAVAEALLKVVGEQID